MILFQAPVVLDCTYRLRSLLWPNITCLVANGHLSLCTLLASDVLRPAVVLSCCYGLGCQSI